MRDELLHVGVDEAQREVKYVLTSDTIDPLAYTYCQLCPPDTAYRARAKAQSLGLGEYSQRPGGGCWLIAGMKPGRKILPKRRPRRYSYYSMSLFETDTRSSVTSGNLRGESTIMVSEIELGERTGGEGGGASVRKTRLTHRRRQQPQPPMQKTPSISW